MKKTIRILDFSYLPIIDGMDIFKRHDLDVENALKKDGPLVEVFERSHAALMFFCGVGRDNDEIKNSAYLRAGLNEFYSLEDAAKRDFRSMGQKIDPPKISSSPNPLVHIMYILRHVNVHAMISATIMHKTSVISRFGGEEHEIDWGSIILESATLKDLMKCGEAKSYYKDEDLQAASEWLDSVQCIFGVGEVFRRGLSSYCRDLLRASGLIA